MSKFSVVLVVASLLLAILWLLTYERAAPASLPHIVLVMADDLGIGDARCYNDASAIATPQIDRIAAAGMRFVDVHSPSAVCTPTRYGLLTGRYAWRSRMKRGVLGGYSRMLIEPDRTTLASMLAARGYHTGCVGKWHLGLGDAERTDYSGPLNPGPNAVGFDWFFGIPASLDMPPYVFVEDGAVVEAPTEKIAASAHRRRDGGGFWRGGPIAPSFRHRDVLPELTRRAVEFITRHDTARPMFLYVPLSAPHTPWLPAEAFRHGNGAGDYGAFVAMVDDAIGQIDRALERAGIADETLLIVTSDNGAHWPVVDIETYGHRANGRYRGQKADIHEGGHRVPFVVRWPGRVEAGRTTTQTACLTDVMATLAAITDAELDPDAAPDSCDLTPVLLRGETVARPAVVHHSLSGMFAIREGPWKLIVGRGSGGFTAPRTIADADLAAGEPRGQLYSLERDPGETTNLWAAEPEIVARLTARLASFKSSGRSVPQSH